MGKVDSIKDAKLLDPAITGEFKIGYARITQFNKPTAEDLDKKLGELEGKGMQALIPDLRYGNPGGLLNSAVDVAGLFLPPGTVVVSTEGRADSQKHSYATDEKTKPRKYPVAILINGSSASGAEIVAGALKDLNRAILVGETTFGKGSVQSVIQLPDGSALRLTTAKYLAPRARQVIHEHGVDAEHPRHFHPPSRTGSFCSSRKEESSARAGRKPRRPEFPSRYATGARGRCAQGRDDLRGKNRPPRATRKPPPRIDPAGIHSA